jgi:hypothetical protein
VALGVAVPTWVSSLGDCSSLACLQHELGGLVLVLAGKAYRTWMSIVHVYCLSVHRTIRLVCLPRALALGAICIAGLTLARLYRSKLTWLFLGFWGVVGDSG